MVQCILKITIDNRGATEKVLIYNAPEVGLQQKFWFREQKFIFKHCRKAKTIFKIFKIEQHALHSSKKSILRAALKM